LPTPGGPLQVRAILLAGGRLAIGAAREIDESKAPQ
jgi:hypothetical protein